MKQIETNDGNTMLGCVKGVKRGENVKNNLPGCANPD